MPSSSAASPSGTPRRRRGALLAAALALVALAGGVWLVRETAFWRFFQDREAVLSFVRSWGRWAPVATILLHIAQVLFAPIPGQLLDATNGYLFGPWLGTAYSMIGLGTGSTLAMLLARRFGRPLVERLVDAETIARLDGLVREHGRVFVFVVFLLPFLPDDAVCFLAGLAPIPFAHLVLLAMVGRLPGVAVANWVGSTMSALSPLQIGLFAAVALVVSILAWRFRTRLGAALLRLSERVSSIARRHPAGED